jgi:hypothetical protein
MSVHGIKVSPVTLDLPASKEADAALTPIATRFTLIAVAMPFSDSNDFGWDAGALVGMKFLILSINALFFRNSGDTCACAKGGGLRKAAATI